MIYYRLKNFHIPNNLKSELTSLDWLSLEVASEYRAMDWMNQAFQRHMVWQTLHTYGYRLQQIGRLVSCNLPLSVEQNIRDFVQQCHGVKLASQAVIRLQIIYGGSIIPIHTDLNRETSLVYPILHHSPSVTAFYQSCQSFPRGIIPPDSCQYVDSVCIDTCPALLDVSMPHAVLYQLGSFTKNRPRVSLSLKFVESDINTVRGLIE